MTNYVLRLSDYDLRIIDQLLQNAPYKIAAPIISSINAQLSPSAMAPHPQGTDSNPGA